jgi:hypothetical protein
LQLVKELGSTDLVSNVEDLAQSVRGECQLVLQLYLLLLELLYAFVLTALLTLHSPFFYVHAKFLSEVNFK